MNADRVPILGPGGKVVAVVVGACLTKSIDGSRHMLRNPQAIALDAGAIAQADALHVTQIAITDRETDRVYRCTLREFYAHSWRFDRGYGPQIAMRLSRWQVDGDQGKKTEQPAAEQPQAAALQLALL